MKLDKSKPYAVIMGTARAKFEQNNVCFDAQGNEIEFEEGPSLIEDEEESRPTKKVAKAKAKPADDQLARQLEG